MAFDIKDTKCSVSSPAERESILRDLARFALDRVSASMFVAAIFRTSNSTWRALLFYKADEKYRHAVFFQDELRYCNISAKEMWVSIARHAQQKKAWDALAEGMTKNC